MQQQRSSGFTLIEIALAVAVVTVAMVPILQAVGGLSNNSGKSVDRASIETSNYITDTRSIVSDIKASSFQTVANNLTTLAGTAGAISHIDGSYTGTSATLYYRLSVTNNSFKVDEDFDLVNYDGSSTTVANAKKILPYQNELFQATLTIYKDSGRTQPITAKSFYIANTECTVAAYCEPGDSTGTTSTTVTAMPQTTLCWLIDVSGSMSAGGTSGSGNRLEEVKTSLLTVLTAMEADNDIAANVKIATGKFNHTASILQTLEAASPTYAGTRGWLTPSTPLTPGGGTAIHEAVSVADAYLQTTSWGDAPGMNRIVVLSDGGSSQSAAVTAATNAWGNGTYVDTISFYQGCNAVMQATADAGNGTCYPAANATDLVNVFTTIVTSATGTSTEHDWLEGHLCRLNVSNPTCTTGPTGA